MDFIQIFMLTIMFVFNVAWSSDSSQKHSMADNRTKRLLLNDPDVVGERLTNLERTIQDLRKVTVQQAQSISQLQGDLTREQNVLSQLQGDLTAEKNVISQLQGDLTAEKNVISQLQGDLTAEKNVISQLQGDLTLEKNVISQLQRDLTREQNVTSQLQAELNLMKDHGSTYVRWGRKQCSGVNTEMIYTGFTTGQAYLKSNYIGGPSNMLCLPNNPELSNRTVPGNSYLYGTEFEDGDFFRKGAQNEDIPCAFCRSKDTTASVMIPGRKSCYNGWRLEYQGIIASGSESHKPSSYICVDSNPEYVQGGERDDNGHLLYATGAKCGSLPCPPYGNNLAIYCVVCSK